MVSGHTPRSQMICSKKFKVSSKSSYQSKINSPATTPPLFISGLIILGFQPFVHPPYKTKHWHPLLVPKKPAESRLPRSDTPRAPKHQSVVSTPSPSPAYSVHRWPYLTQEPIMETIHDLLWSVIWVWKKKRTTKKNGTESSPPPHPKNPPKKCGCFFLGGCGGWVGWKKNLPHLGALRRGSQEPGSREGPPHPYESRMGMVWERWEAYGKGESHYFGVVGGNPFKT